MSALPDDGTLLTVAEYLKFEELSERRHELIRGEVRLMSGGSERHDLLTQAINLRLLRTLWGGPCRVFPHNRKLLAPDGNVYYPDLMVTCSASADPRYENDARWLFEVLSPSNKRAELDDKLEHYTGLPSLQAYVTLDPETRAVTVYQRHDLGWRSLMLAGGMLDLGEVSLDIDAVYDEVDAITAR